MQPGPQYPYGGGGAPPAKKSNGWIVILVVLLVGAVLVLPVLAATAIYGVRRYLASAKTSEAKNTISAIGRGAVMAYEYERAGSAPHRLCATATPVPLSVPSGKKYQPSMAAGADFDSGDADTGWKCLKFSMTQAMYYQYSYHQGSGYLATASNPGPAGFEAAARGDLDADGEQSLFALTGTVTGGTVRVSTSLYVEAEFE